MIMALVARANTEVIYMLLLPGGRLGGRVVECFKRKVDLMAGGRTDVFVERGGGHPLHFMLYVWSPPPARIPPQLLHPRPKARLPHQPTHRPSADTSRLLKLHRRFKTAPLFYKRSQLSWLTYYSKRNFPEKLPYSPQPSTTTAPSHQRLRKTMPQATVPHTMTSWQKPPSNTSLSRTTHMKRSALPTSDSLLISRVPVSALSPDPALLQTAIADAVHLATGIAVGNACTLLPWERITKQTTSLVPSTDAASLIKKGILLFNRVRPVRAMWSATPPLSAPFASDSATQLLAALRASPTANAAAYVATPRTHSELIPAFNASQNQLCQRRSMVYALAPPSGASIAAPTTQPTLPLVQSV